ncbi:hypothetical protein ACT6J7_003300 [Escherichia coli]|nr:phage tail protein [Escherichia coli]EHH7718258.1 phage tail protein [Escherichia coli]
MSDNNLRLQVILNAVDKLTRPFRSAQASSRELAAAVKKSRDAIKQLDQAGSSLDSFRKLQAENQKLGDRLNYARQRANLLSQELGAMGPPSQRQVVALGRQRLAVQRLEERQKKLQQQTALVRAELYRAGISAKDDAGATARLARETSRYNQELSKQEARLKRLGEAQRRMNAARASYTVKSVTGALRRWVEANPELTGTLMKASAVVAAVTVGLGTLAVALAAVLGPLAVIRLGFSVLGIKTLSSVTAAVTRTSSALSWLAGAPLALLRRGLASSGNAAGLLTAPLSSLRRTASLTGNVLKTVAGAPVALLRSGLSGLRAVAVMFMNPLAVLRGGLAAAGAVLRVLASGPLAMLRVALYAISGLLGALLSPIGLVVTALAGVALVVWKYWQPITAFLGGVVEGFKAAAGPISAAFEPLKPVFQWIGDKVQALWGWFTDLLTPVKSTSAELQSAAAMGRRFGEALAEGLNMVMHPLDSLKSGVSWLLEKLGIVSKEAAKAKLPESVTRQQPATVNADGKVMMPSGGFPSWGYGFAGMYDSGGYIPRGQFGIVGENGPEIVNGPANVTSRRNTAALAAVVAGMMGVAAAPAELPPLHPLALPTKGGEAIVSRAATVPLVQRIEAPTQIIIQTQPGQSAQDIAREVARQLDERERRLKAKARSNYSDQGGYDA